MLGSTIVAMVGFDLLVAAILRFGQWQQRCLGLGFSASVGGNRRDPGVGFLNPGKCMRTSTACGPRIGFHSLSLLYRLLPTFKQLSMHQRGLFGDLLAIYMGGRCAHLFNSRLDRSNSYKSKLRGARLGDHCTLKLLFLVFLST